ncbi:RNA-binding protein, putative [Perkinsus marinus ATCC 50983]|uniref:RNA-binding protein, putative n=1 Tax=Perkinsus marinus (strain ATCC 50983 / TXsc) TaxID=423536 RepID=C5KQ49_PERM5|nr:RNA-binding protein, putative [Perkinsus marinus ATCC 50983]EER13404.1 RNA-binding protein, putative [Perkinsus marinus ATCC 50983]|eukprot:XP_002781609.1 RNA-binding protein, putative [Perkinsus marinus ATCC 50983]
MPIENGESPISEGTSVTNDQTGNLAAVLSLDKESDEQGHVTKDQGASTSPMRRAIALSPTVGFGAAAATTTFTSSATSSSSATTTSDDCKLFVGALPYFMTEQELYPLFAKFGTIIELSVQRDKLGRSRGCAWLRYSSVTECEACIRGLHNHYWLGSMKRPLQVITPYSNLVKDTAVAQVQFSSSSRSSPTTVFCDDQQQQYDRSYHPDGKSDDLAVPPKKRVFVGGLPKDADEHDLLSMIQSVQGEVVCDVKVVRKNGNSDGAAFVEFITPEQARAFMEMYGSGQQAILRGRPIVLRLDWPKPQDIGYAQNLSSIIAAATAAATAATAKQHAASVDRMVSDNAGYRSRQIPFDDGCDDTHFTGIGSEPQSGNEDSPSRTLFISGLPISFSLENVVTMFNVFCPMRDVQLVSFPPGCAVVTFDSEQDAERARVTYTGRSFSVRPMIDNQQDPYEILDRGYSAMHYISRKESPGNRRMRPNEKGFPLFVFRLPSATDESEIAEVFSEFGQVSSVHILPFRRLAIVSFNTLEEAVNAMTAVNLRIASSDNRVPVNWLASGVHLELEHAYHDDLSTGEAHHQGCHQESSSDYRTAFACGPSSSSGHRQPFGHL